MSRSYKKNASLRHAELSEWKADTNRSFRRTSKAKLSVDPEEAELPQNIREVSDIWLSPIDGCSRYLSKSKVDEIMRMREEMLALFNNPSFFSPLKDHHFWRK